MTPPADTKRYKNYRFPPEIISHGVWLYYRFTLSYRDVQEILLERGIEVSHRAIRGWCQKFGQDYAKQLRRRRPRVRPSAQTAMASPRRCWTAPKPAGKVLIEQGGENTADQKHQHQDDSA